MHHVIPSLYQAYSYVPVHTLLHEWRYDADYIMKYMCAIQTRLIACSEYIYKYILLHPRAEYLHLVRYALLEYIADLRGCMSASRHLYRLFKLLHFYYRSVVQSAYLRSVQLTHALGNCVTMDCPCQRFLDVVVELNVRGPCLWLRGFKCAYSGCPGWIPRVVSMNYFFAASVKCFLYILNPLCLWPSPCRNTWRTTWASLVYLWPFFSPCTTLNRSVQWFTVKI